MAEPAGSNIAASFTYPGTVVAERPKGVWFGLGIGGDDLAAMAGEDNALRAGDTTVDRLRDATVVFVEYHEGRPSAVTAWKGLTSIHEIFYAALPDGSWQLSDHFHNVLTSLPSELRAMSDQALVEHYVGAAVYGRTTYSRGVSRLANGDRMRLDLPSGRVDVDIFSRHRSLATDDPTVVHLQRLNGAFRDVLEPLQSAADFGVAFSGGVDSTLLASYLDGAGTTLTIVPGCPEFDPETEYAREAARVVGRTITEIRLREADYRRHVESAIELLGFPIESYAVAMLTHLYRHDLPLFLVGEAADSIFGSGRGIRRVASLLSGPIGRSLLRMAEKTPDPMGRRAHQLHEYAELFGKPALSPRGYAGTVLQYHGDKSGTIRMFGEDAIDRLADQMIHEVADRVELETVAGDGFNAHIEIAQWRLLFADLALAGNHAAHALGKHRIQPYSSWRVISEFLKIPARDRYYRGFSGKWALKQLLAERVPSYQVNKQKLATGLPFARYFTNGPLSDIWDHYDIPDVIPSGLVSEVRTRPSPLTWKAITHAIWDERVVSNAALRPHPAAVERTLTTRQPS